MTGWRTKQYKYLITFAIVLGLNCLIGGSVLALDSNNEVAVEETIVEEVSSNLVEAEQAQDLTTNDTQSEMEANSTAEAEVKSTKEDVFVQPTDNIPTAQDQSNASDDEVTNETTTDESTPVPEDAKPKVVTTGKVELVKLQLADFGKVCASRKERAEFALFYNFDDESIELQNWSLQWTAATANDGEFIISKSIILEPNQFLLFYNDNLTYNSNYCQPVKDWLQTIDAKFIINKTPATDVFHQATDLKLLDSTAKIIDQVQVANTITDGQDDTISAQVYEDRFYRDDGGRLDLISFSNKNGAVSQDDFPLYIPPNFCTGVEISEVAINVNTSQQFIELHNTTNQPINLNGCYLSTYLKQHLAYDLQGELAAKQYKVYYLEKTNLEIAKLGADQIRLHNEDDSIVHNLKYQTSAAKSSIAKIKGVFKQTYHLTPGEANIYQKYPTCAPGYEIGFTGSCVKKCLVGYYRNASTNKCQKKLTAIPGQGQGNVANDKPVKKSCAAGYEIGFTGTCVKKCLPGYYRSPTTNRCRKTGGTKVSTALKPCKPGYKRNPLTNRCRKIKLAKASSCQAGYEIGFTGTCVKKCQPGYSRSKTTNRCRKNNQLATLTNPNQANIDQAEADAKPKVISWWDLLPYAGGGLALVAAFVIWDRWIEIKTFFGK